MMSKTGGGGGGGEEEEEEVECFHDSLDRLHSSSNTSCSCSPTASESEDPNPYSNPGSPDYVCQLPAPKFPMGLSNNYDLWLSEPSSIQERRQSLLRQMGLSRELPFIRHRPSGFDSGGRLDFLSGGSVSLEQMGSLNPGEVVSNPKSYNNNTSITYENKEKSVSEIVQSGGSKSSGTVLVKSVSSLSVFPSDTGNAGVEFVHNNCNFNKTICDTGAVDNLMKGNGSVSECPKGKVKTIAESTCNESCDLSSVAGNVKLLQEGVDYDGVVRADDLDPLACTIKNLDNGKEFVVNEVREDGTWNKLKEVGTGRQLTMEEFELCVGTSPIVQELMRRQNVEDGNRLSVDSNVDRSSGSGSKLKKNNNWLKSLKNVANSVIGNKERRSSDEKDTSSEKGGRRSSSATDDSQDGSFHGPEKIRIKQYGKSFKELTAMYKNQEMHAHTGSIWTIKFSLDGKYLASAGEDCIINVWKVVEVEKKGDLLLDKQEDGGWNNQLLGNASPEIASVSPSLDGQLDRRRRGRLSKARKSVSLDHAFVPDTVFAFAEKPFCSFHGHLDDVLDLSWSKSQHLLSSSMDKTVRLWHFSSKSCLKIFSHSDYVTCIHFNPVDDRYFISGSLDAKVRIWSIPERKVVDWNDLHEMVTAACYTPDGQGALVGSYKGSCHSYNMCDNKLLQRSQINLLNKRKKSHQKKITGFQFAPGSTLEVLISSADSRIRVVDGVDLVHKFKGFRNTNSQISASVTSNGKYVVCASEDSQVYIWRHETDSRPSRSKSATVTWAYEHFHCQDVSVAVPWNGTWETWGGLRDSSSTSEHGGSGDFIGGAQPDEAVAAATSNHPPTPVEETNNGNGSSSLVTNGFNTSPLHGIISGATNSYFFDRISATWPEEKLALRAKNRSSPRVSVDFNRLNPAKSPAWGMVIVTAGLKGEIKVFQNFGYPNGI